MKKMTKKRRLIHILLCLFVLAAFTPAGMPELTYADTGWSPLEVGEIDYQIYATTNPNLELVNIDDQGNGGGVVARMELADSNPPYYYYRVMFFGIQSQKYGMFALRDKSTQTIEKYYYYKTNYPSTIEMNACVGVPFTIRYSLFTSGLSMGFIGGAPAVDRQTWLANQYDDHGQKRFITEEYLTIYNEGVWTVAFYDSWGVEKEYKVTVGAHQYDNGVVSTEPTQKNTGVLTKTCAVCGRTTTEQIPKIPYELEMNNGGVQDVTIHCDGFNGGTSNLTVSSSDADIVSASGKSLGYVSDGTDVNLSLFARKPGTATVTVSNASNGTVYGTANVTVTGPKEETKTWCVGKEAEFYVPYISDSADDDPSFTFSNELDMDLVDAEELASPVPYDGNLKIGKTVPHNKKITLQFNEAGTTDLHFYDPDANEIATYHLVVGEHSYVLDNKTDATCLERSVETYRCEHCGDTYQETVGDLADHAWNDSYTVDKAATCTEEGSESIHCAVCGISKEGTARSIEMLEHAYGDWVTTQPATCTEDGVREKVCSGCGDVVTETIPAKGHIWRASLTVDKEATCTEDGVRSVHCSVCDAVKEGSERTIPATGHQWNETYSMDKAATCTESGLESIHCTKCDAVQEGSGREIPMLGHAYSDWITVKGPTCTEAGSKQKTCERCGDVVTEPIPATGHHWNEGYTTDQAATCTEDGLESIHCSVCNKMQEGSSRVIPALGHSYGEWRTVKEPTCTEKGSKQRVCERCGNIDIEDISATGHMWNTKYTIDRSPTCTTEGLESIHCSVCDAVQEGSGRAIPMTEHTWSAWRTVTAATYDTAGLEEHVCNGCGLKVQREIPMLPRTDLEEIEITGIADMTFTGTALMQGQTLKANGIVMTEGTDYEAVYENNVNVGTATMTLTGIGRYKGTVTKTFEILPANVEDMSFPTFSVKTYSGSALTPTFTATYNGIKYPSKTTDQFDAKYSSNVNTGTATIIVTGKGNFTGTKELHFTIQPKAITPTVTLSSTSFAYTGKARSPGVTVRYGTKTLTKSTDYTISQSSGRIYPGKYSVTVKLKGNYSGSKTLSFYVKGDLSKSVTKVSVGSISNKTYTGSAIKPSPTVKAIGPKGKVVTLKKGTDYTLSYSNNKNVGKATITIKGKGNYTGTKKVTFKIVPKPTTITEVGPSEIKWKKASMSVTGYQIQISRAKTVSKAESFDSILKTITVTGSTKTSCSYPEAVNGYWYVFRIRTYKTVNGVKYYSPWKQDTGATMWN